MAENVTSLNFEYKLMRGRMIKEDSMLKMKILAEDINTTLRSSEFLHIILNKI